jgi:creatinine amidohydrolase
MFYNWRDLTSEDFRRVDPERAVAVMPVAAIEQHGPHLPVSVDSDINAGILAASAAFIPADTPVYALPQLPIGKSNEHSGYPGTLTIGAETLIRMWTDVAESIVRAGFRKLLVLNSHGGQPQVVDIVVREMRVRHKVLAVAASTYALGQPDGLFTAEEKHHGIHGGAIETSIMLHLRPEAVRRDRIMDFPSSGIEIERHYQMLRLEGGIGIGWMTQDVNVLGAVGDATAADGQRGAQLVAFAAERLGTLLAEISRYPLESLRG